ncbi:hypothetical protein [Paenibacillus motobuensis]|uniref:Tetratricopeptide repeat protein n=1 Tax=Paenibacillus motobuensis TaxID=295324 RepID=A0ABN0YBI4_9BACL
MEKKWIPIEVDELPSTDDFMDRLNKWTKDPESDPELEEWYKYGAPEGLSFQIKKPEQWELDHEIYFPMYDEAQRLEMNEHEEKALSIYLEIHEKFIPRGTAYYDHLLWILEKRGQFDKAIEICEKAIDAISRKLFNADVEPYNRDITRLKTKKIQCKDFPSYESFVFSKIIELVKENPNINVTTLQSKLDNNDVYGGRSYIDKAVEQNLITREKRGRSLIHNLP